MASSKHTPTPPEKPIPQDAGFHEFPANLDGFKEGGVLISGARGLGIRGGGLDIKRGGGLFGVDD